MSDRTFEKLLDEKKVMWRHVADEVGGKSFDAAPDKKALSLEAHALKDAKDRPQRATYVIDAPEDDLNEILAELEKNAKRVDSPSGGRSEQLHRDGLRRRESPETSSRLPRSLVITLFCPAETSPAAPAEKAP
jgi:hypothetical protein